MKFTMAGRRHFFGLFLVASFVAMEGIAHRASAGDTGWKAGVATVVITPEKSMRMAGYASRKTPSEGTAQDLFAKALALEDVDGSRLVIVTTDLIGIPRQMRDSMEKQVQEKFKLPPRSLLLNASHTHCGPVVSKRRAETDPGIASEQVADVSAYADLLEQKLVSLIGKALENLAPATLGYSHGRAGFAMNRRLPTDKGFQNSPYPDGPVDHTVPVLRIDGADGKLRAVLFGYACHNTTLGFMKFCGDYAGYAQQYLEEAHPGTTALFLMGCGGDQNPYPRGVIEQAQQHGRALANGVETALLPKARPITGPLRTALETATLEFGPIPTREELVARQKGPEGIDKQHATKLLAVLDKEGKLQTTYPYLVQAIQFGNDLTLVALAGEVVIDYAVRLHREIDTPIVWIAGYSNDVFGYIPSERVLKEGGYEAGGAMKYSAFPGPFAPSVEEIIVKKVHEVVQEVRQSK